MYGAGDVRVVDAPDPAIQQGTDALVRVVRACICGSDLHPYRSMPANPEGTPMGHEFVGVVEQVGAKVSTLTTGDVVIAPFAWSDGTCEFCARGCTPPACTEGSGQRMG
jgi:threonine dehydrogenase-like Zn-dependent dehydrogenase